MSQVPEHWNLWQHYSTGVILSETGEKISDVEKLKQVASKHSKQMKVGMSPNRCYSIACTDSLTYNATHCVCVRRNLTSDTSPTISFWRVCCGTRSYYSLIFSAQSSCLPPSAWMTMMTSQSDSLMGFGPLRSHYLPRYHPTVSTSSGDLRFDLSPRVHLIPFIAFSGKL